jgi:hypothetical protein
MTPTNMTPGELAVWLEWARLRRLRNELASEHYTRNLQREAAKSIDKRLGV